MCQSCCMLHHVPMCLTRVVLRLLLQDCGHIMLCDMDLVHTQQEITRIQQLEAGALQALRQQAAVSGCALLQLVVCLRPAAGQHVCRSYHGDSHALPAACACSAAAGDAPPAASCLRCTPAHILAVSPGAAGGTTWWRTLEFVAPEVASDGAVAYSPASDW